MKKEILALLLMSPSLAIYGQSAFSGKITDEKKCPSSVRQRGGIVFA